MKTKVRLECWKTKSRDRDKSKDEIGKDEIGRWSMKTKLEVRESNICYLKRRWRKFPWKNGGERCAAVVEDGGEWRTIFSSEKRPRYKRKLQLWDSEEVSKNDGRCATAAEDGGDTTTTKESNTALRQHCTDTLLILKH